jgi:zinc transport system substrate-binding protein
MIKKIKLTIVALSMGLIALTGCQNQTPETETTEIKETIEEKVEVTVSILPQEYFVKRIGGDHVAVNVMVLPGASEEFYEPKPEQLRLLANSKVYFKIGLLPFEEIWLDRFSAANSNMLIVDTSEGVELQTMEHEHHNHNHNHNHQEGDLDPHIWLSPQSVKIQANTIYETLAKIDPDNIVKYRENLEQFTADVEKLHQEITEKLSGLSNRKFMVFHPTWGYFAQDYNLEMIPIEIDGKEPSARQLTNIIKLGRNEGIKVIFTQPEFSTATAENIAQQIGAEVLLISPLAPNWLENMRDIADKMYESLTKNDQANLHLKMLLKA